MLNNEQILTLVQLQTGKKAAIHKATGVLYIETGESVYSPIEIQNSGIIATQKDILFDSKDLMFVENKAVNQAQISVKSGLQQPEIRQESGQNQEQIRTESGQNQAIISPISEKNQQILLINQINKRLFSEKKLTEIIKISGEKFDEIRITDQILPIPVPTDADEPTQQKIAELNKRIYALVFTALSSTQNEHKIAEIKNIYILSQKYANKLQIRELKQNANKLAKIINKQNGANKSRKIGEKNRVEREKQKAQRIRIVAFSLSLTFFLVLVFAMIKSAFTGTPLPETNFIQAKNTVIIPDTTEVLTLINRIATKEQITITEWRKGMVLKTVCCQEFSNPQEFVFTVDSLIKYGWK